MDHVLPYLISAASLLANLFLFFSLKREIHAQSRKHRGLVERFTELEARQEPPLDAAAAPPRPGFNLNTRVQAMRLWRQGEAPAHIAARLGVPCKEVELLIRVRSMAGETSTPAPR